MPSIDGQDKEPLFFAAEIKTLVWGSEHWTISAHEHGDVRVSAGRFAGKSLSALWEEEPQLFGRGESPPTEPFPLLVKIISANDDLSIQVHPDDEYAAVHENGALGKTECWYILDCAADTRLVLSHHAKGSAELRRSNCTAKADRKERRCDHSGR